LINNVFINVFEDGRLIEQYEGHNVWVDRGRQYLAEMAGYTEYTVPTPERSERVRYMGLGIGGDKQNRLDLANAAPIVTAYPAGFDPLATTGNTYRKEYPIDPFITSLERPIRITGGTNPYASAAPTDEWLLDDPNLFFTHLSLYELTVHGFINCGAGEVIYGPWSEMPLSEMALFTDETGIVDKNIPYSLAVAYFSFDTILLNSKSVLEFIWRVRFA
jgi:hypothetical protein